MNTKILIGTVVALTAAAAFADGAAENELVKEEGRGRWTLTAGPSWRSRVKMETHGRIAAPAPTPRSTTKRDMTDSANWTNPGLVADPNAGTGGIPADGKLWGVSDTRTEIYGAAGRDYSVNASDEERPLGLNLQGCYDFLQGETWSVGLNLRFAGYWNMKSESRGRFDAGSTRTETWQDDYIFPNEDPTSAFEPTPWTSISPNGSTMLSSRTDTLGSRDISTRLRADLYQIGLGPKVTWSPFVGWCEWMEWLDVYGGVEILCNLAHTEFDADGSSSSQTDCLLGFGGNVGLVGNITDWIGIYGQVGYEWVDKSDVSTGGFKADIDYSSLVLSAGVQVRF